MFKTDNFSLVDVDNWTPCWNNTLHICFNRPFKNVKSRYLLQNIGIIFYYKIFLARVKSDRFDNC